MGKVRRQNDPRKGAVLARVVAGQAQLAERFLSEPDLDPRRRADIENRLEHAYAALRPTWKASTLRAAVVRALDGPARYLARGTWSEAWAVDQAVERITGALQDRYAPDEHRGAKPPRALVLACLKAPPTRRGPTAQGRKTRNAVLLDLFKALGISGASSPRAVGKMLERSRRRRPP